MEHPVKHLFDSLSVSIVLATMMRMLPAIAAVFSIVWTLIRIYETATVQRLLRGRGRSR